MTVREYNDETDRQAVVALWNRVFGSPAGHNEPSFSIEQKMRVRDGLLFVAVVGAKIIGTVMVGYDGHRGWIYSLAVLPEERRRGVGAALMHQAEQALVAKGCAKVNLQIVDSNAEVVGFYAKLGYGIEPRISMGKRLEADPAAPGARH